MYSCELVRKSRGLKLHEVVPDINQLRAYTTRTGVANLTAYTCIILNGIVLVILYY